jgi:hypothetical protein
MQEFALVKREKALAQPKRELQQSLSEFEGIARSQLKSRATDANSACAGAAASWLVILRQMGSVLAASLSGVAGRIVSRTVCFVMLASARTRARFS